MWLSVLQVELVDEELFRVVFPLELKEHIRLWIRSTELFLRSMQPIRQIVSTAERQCPIDQCAAENLHSFIASGGIVVLNLRRPAENPSG